MARNKKKQSKYSYNSRSHSVQEMESENEFSDKKIRRGFIRKVYSILCCQLIFTMGIIAFFIYVEPVRKFVRKHSWLMYVALGISLVFMIVLSCFEKIRRRSPLNYILLLLFTICEGCFLGIVSTFYGRDLVLMAIGITAVVSFALTIFAIQAKCDFTPLIGILFVVVIVFMCFGILCIFVRNRYLHLVYTCLGVLIFSVYLVVDTQMMLGGNHKYSISPEDYIFAVLNLYVDIINLFVFILSLANNCG